MLVLDKESELITLHPAGDLHVSTNFHGNLSGGCKDILVLTKVLNWPKDSVMSKPLVQLITPDVTEKLLKYFNMLCIKGIKVLRHWILWRQSFAFLCLAFYILALKPLKCGTFPWSKKESLHFMIQCCWREFPPRASLPGLIKKKKKKGAANISLDSPQIVCVPTNHKM